MQPASVDIVSQSIRDASTSRYFIAAGAVVLFYDHLITLPDECRFVWKAKPSFAKYAFLLNRYAVLSVMVLVLPATCGIGPTLSNLQCQCIVLATGMASIISMGIANALILLRVLVLWQDNRNITRRLWGGYLLSLLVTASMMLLTCIKALPGIRWSTDTRTCVPAMKTPFLPAGYGAPIFFEVLVIYLVAYHALSTPRTARMPLNRSLRQNGLAFFTTVFFLRLVSMFAAIYVRASLVFLTVFFIWASVTVNLSHSILRLRRADVKHYLLAKNTSLDRVASPFELFRTGSGPDFDKDVLEEFDDIKTEVAEELELRPLENPCQKPREITIYLGGTRPFPPSRARVTQGWHV